MKFIENNDKILKLSISSYRKVMASLPSDKMPKNWLHQAVFDIFGKNITAHEFNKYYSIIRNVRQGNSYKLGIEHGIIPYILKKANISLADIQDL